MTEALADLQDQLIDADTLAQLLGDIELATQLVEVRVKRGTNSHAETSKRELSQVHSALAEGSAVQLRYVWRDKQWCDTLLPTAGGVRLVRAELPFTPRCPSP